MGRRKSIDRDAILDAAESIVLRDGAAAMTVATVAAEVGATNGGIQYSFRTKDALIDAMFDRWTADYDRAAGELANVETSNQDDGVAAHVELTQQRSAGARGAAMLVAALSSPRHRDRARDWYRERLAAIDTRNRSGREARLAFLAAEGAYLLRMLRLVDMTDGECEAIAGDLQLLLSPRAGEMRSAA